MKKYLAPLGVFATGQIFLLFAFLFLSHIGTRVDAMQTETVAFSSNFWNFTWLTGTVVQFIIYIGIELATLYVTAKAFLAIR